VFHVNTGYSHETLCNIRIDVIDVVNSEIIPYNAKKSSLKCYNYIDKM